MPPALAAPPLVLPPRPAPRPAVHLPVLALTVPAALLLASRVAAAQAQPSGAVRPAVVRGLVTDATSGAPVRAVVTCPPPARPVRTAADGHFACGPAAPDPRAPLAVAAFGYRPERRTLRLTSGADTLVRVALAPQARVLEEVRATASADRLAGPAGPPALTMSARELSSIPALGEPDALRAASLLPGIAARNDLWAGFNVRGGESDQTLVRLDGVPVFSPFHLGGLFGTFIPAAVAAVDARAGALPASAGGRLSGVLDVTSAEEARPGAHGTLDLSAVSAAATVGGAAAGGRASWNVAVRRTYADLLTSAVVGPDAFPYHFQDAQLRAAALLPGGGTLALTGYAGLDLLSPSDDSDGGLFGDSTGAFRFAWGNRAAGLALVQPLGTAAELTQRLFYTGYATRYTDDGAGVRLANGIGEVRLAGEVARRAGGRPGAPAHALRAGYEAARFGVRYEERVSAAAADDFGPVLAIADTSFRQASTAFALYAEDAWAPDAGRGAGARWSVRPGVRVERVPAARWAGVSPRLALKYRAGGGPNGGGTNGGGTALTLAGGRYAQWVHAVRNEDLPVRVVDVWLASDASIPVSTGTEVVGGAERWVTPGVVVRAEAYAKRFADLVEPASAVDPRLRPAELRRFGGRSTGVDVLVRRVAGPGGGTSGAEGPRLSGWVAYSYARSVRGEGADRYYPAHDRRHDLNVVGSYRLGARYTFGARLGVAGGTPYTAFAGTYSRWTYDPVARRWRIPGATNSARNEPVLSARNAERYPAYKRLDLSAHRAFRLRGASGDAFLNVVNALNTRNVLLYAFDTGDDPPRVRGLSQLPLLPTVGVRVGF